MESRIWIALAAVLACAAALQASNETDDALLRRYVQDAHLDTAELIAKNGYPAETHTVTTEDGYIITFHRIPYGKAGPSRNRPVVFLQHGLMCSSGVWVLAGSEKSPGFILADAGYDVWIGNTRGNLYARKHVSLKPTDRRFWQFSWHENGYYDLPAQIDYALQRTGQSSLYYMGHSMGTTSFYAMASSRPEYNKKIRAHFSLAPVAFMSNLKSPLLRVMSTFQHSLDTLLNLMGNGEFMPSSAFIASVSAIACHDNSMIKELCSNMLFLACGFNKQQFNITLLPIITGHAPAGSSTFQLIHYSQGMWSGKFRRYSYGTVKNLLTYGSLNAPDYDLSKITAPVYLHWSSNDWMAAVKDVKELESKLPNVKESRQVPDPKFNHLDFMWAIDVKPLLFDAILAQMKKH
ncbi:lipase 3-like isoform X1 [Bacillus rossius redtenbacheri]|uniref:lipase 3-like isoform X1 n=1 Tax=Bacillus rossius redtenbacheri TaxID=93214 RepID=UPI002FDEF880